jgi:hypothetical protein
MPMTPKIRKWLELVSLSSKGSGYPGTPVDVMPPKIVREIERNGWADLFIPHNPSHKERLVITQAGRDALAQQ